MSYLKKKDYVFLYVNLIYICIIMISLKDTYIHRDTIFDFKTVQSDFTQCQFT